MEKLVYKTLDTPRFSSLSAHYQRLKKYFKNLFKKTLKNRIFSYDMMPQNRIEISKLIFS